MSKLSILLTTGSLFMCLIGRSQSFIGLPYQNATWTHWWDNSSSGGSFELQIINTVGDTVINSNQYIKLMSEYDGVYSYMGAFRNDTATSRVMIVPKDSTAERVIYDYSIEDIDTLYDVYINARRTPDMGELKDIVVGVIDSFQINGDYHMIYAVFDLDQIGPATVSDYWYEGFGSGEGILGTSVWEYSYVDYRRSLCANYSGASYEYVNSGDPTVIPTSSNCLTGIKTKLNLVEIEVYPNPTMGRLFVEFDGSYNGTLKLYDHSGKMVLAQYISRSKQEVSLILESGMYIWRYEKNGMVLGSGTVVVFK